MYACERQKEGLTPRFVLGGLTSASKSNNCPLLRLRFPSSQASQHPFSATLSSAFFSCTLRSRAAAILPALPSKPFLFFISIFHLSLWVSWHRARKSLCASLSPPPPPPFLPPVLPPTLLLAPRPWFQPFSSYSEPSPLPSSLDARLSQNSSVAAKATAASSTR